MATETEEHPFELVAWNSRTSVKNQFLCKNWNGVLEMSIFYLKIDGDDRGMWEDEMGIEEEGLKTVDLKRVRAGLEIERQRVAILGVLEKM